MRRIIAVGLAVLLVATAFGPVTAESTQIDADHGLDTEHAKAEWQQNGYAEGDIDRYDARLAVAEDKGDVADEPAVTDFSDWVRIDYNEEIERTLRIYIPNYVGQPYERAGVESITSDHTAKLEPAENGEYLSITVDVDGPAEIVLPLEWDGQASYTILEKLESRVDRLQQYNPLASQTDWQRINESQLANKGSMTVGDASEEYHIQVDARPDQPDQHWIPAPEDDADQPVFSHVVEENDTQKTVVTSTVNDPPAVRYAKKTTFADRVASQINSAREIPGEILDSIEVPDWVPVVG